MDSTNRLLDDGAVYIEGSKIVDVGRTRDIEGSYSADEIIDVEDNVVMPGFVNSHVHFTSVLGRGLRDDYPIEEWFGTGPPTGLASDKELAAAFDLVCLEMIKAGITCYNAGSKLLDERYKTGLRALHGASLEDYESVLQNVQQNFSDRSNVGLYFPFALLPLDTPTDIDSIYLDIKEVAEKHDFKIHLHVAESKVEIKKMKRRYNFEGSVEYLDRLGLLSSRLIAAHCVHVSPKEIDLLKIKEVGVVHCPVANAKLGDGIAPLIDLMNAGVKIGLGTDGPATNNCIDMFQVMKFACLLQRGVRYNPKIIKAKDVLDMATKGGAKVLGLDNQIGSIEIGKKADIVIVDFEKPHLYPRTDIISHLVYAANASDVDTTIVDGKVIMRNRKVLTLDEPRILERAQDAYEYLASLS
jgi:5-methylthioadenosine/S-adenosylhomocysteine deaminase